MKIYETTHVVVHYASDVRPDVTVTDAAHIETIEWADKHPVVYDVVTHTKSKAYGLGSTDYIACGAKSLTPADILYRAGHVMRYATLGRASERHGRHTDFWQWRACFTLQHYNDKGFTGGFFQQFDGTYDRGCCTLDYTPETLEEVITRFRSWCDYSARFPTAEIRLNKRTIRRYDARGREIGA